MAHHLRHLRDCFGCFTTGITIATARLADGSLAGVTVNSFSSVSLEPALVLFSLDNNSSALHIFQETRYFALNILTEKQIDLSRRFATTSEKRWEGIEYIVGPQTGSPLMPDVLAYMECEKETVYAGGDHSIFIGRVLECHKLSEESPLLYFKGSYRSLGETL